MSGDRCAGDADVDNPVVGTLLIHTLLSHPGEQPLLGQPGVRGQVIVADESTDRACEHTSR